MAGTPSGPPARSRWIAIGGAAFALVAGLLIAALLIHRSSGRAQPPPASQGGLVVQTGRPDDVRLDPKRPLRCFVAGQFVGELPLADCAHRNGVATGALDVGLDQSGALAASGGSGSDLTPLPAPEASDDPDQRSSAAPAPFAERDASTTDFADTSRGRLPGGCWRADGSDWSAEPGPRTLASCAHDLFDGVCARPGEARFGRFGPVMLRLWRGRVAIAPDGRNFRPFVDQDEACALPPPD